MFAVRCFSRIVAVDRIILKDRRTGELNYSQPILGNTIAFDIVAGKDAVPDLCGTLSRYYRTVIAAVAARISADFWKIF